MVLQDVWVRRVKGNSVSGTPENADFLHVCTESGLTGIWGPISQIQSCLVLGFLRQMIVGLNVEKALAAIASARSERHATGYFSMACAACDLALWDLRAKAADVPVSAFFGRPKRESVRCYASLLGVDLFHPPPRAELTELAATYWGLKWAARLGPSEGHVGIRKTLAAITHVREAGVDHLMLDALCGWTFSHAASFLAACEDLKLTWLEEPVSANDLFAYQRITGSSRTPIAAGEHSYSSIDIRNLIDCGVKILQPDAGWCGGLNEFDAAIRFAANTGCSVFPHGGGLLPALHLSVHYPESVVPALEYHLTVEPRRQSFWRDKLEPIEGVLHAPTRPGLGISIDEDAINSSVELRNLEWRS